MIRPVFNMPWVASVLVAVTLTALGAVSACAPAAKESALSMTGSCQLSKDQGGSFMPRGDDLPFTVVADSSFTSEQRLSIERSVGEWNAVANRIAGRDFFRLAYETVPASVRSANGSPS